MDLTSHKYLKHVNVWKISERPIAKSRLQIWSASKIIHDTKVLLHLSGIRRTFLSFEHQQNKFGWELLGPGEQFQTLSMHIDWGQSWKLIHRILFWDSWNEAILLQNERIISGLPCCFEIRHITLKFGLSNYWKLTISADKKGENW